MVLNSKRPIGILNPGVLFGVDDEDTNLYIYGPLGRVKAASQKSIDIWAALVATGSVLFGSPDEACKVASFLKSPRMSRTTSYVCCAVNNCAQAVSALNKIINSKIVVIGCGGIGSLATMLLAGAGVRNLTLVDGDHVEESNFNRQLMWDSSSIGRPKVQVLKECLLQRFKDLKIEIHQEFATKESFSKYVKSVDACLFTADEPIGIAIHAQKLANEIGFTLVTSGYLLNEAIAKLPRGKLTSSETIKWSRGPYSVMPSFGPTNAELAGVSVAMLIHSVANLLPSDHESLSIRWNSVNFPREYDE